MPTNERESPREKIRSWLFKSGSTAKSESIHAHTEYPKSRHIALLGFSPPNTVKTGKECAFHHGKLTRQHSPRRCTTYNSQSIGVDHDFVGEPGGTSKLREYSIADHSRLQKSFRTSGHDHPFMVETKQPGKRQRTSLSASSDLRPASLTEVEHTQNVAGSVHYGQAAGDPHHLRPVKSSATLSEASDDLPMFFSSLKQPASAYERRKRHKTREDRYDIKCTIPRQRKTPVGSRKRERPVKTRRHKAKSGQAMVHDYTAPNVLGDRLTLRSGTTAGLFGKGKASFPVKRRGLPDLAFSELDFLNTSRHEPIEVTENTSKEEIKNVKKAKKATVTKAEISRYFIAGKTRKGGVAEATSDHKYPMEQQRCSFRESELPVIDLPEKPSLGFGTSGVHSVSPVMIVKELDARYVPSMSQRETRSPSRLTSYLTWSRSTAPPSNVEGRSGSPRSRRHEMAAHQNSSFTESQSLFGGNMKPPHGDRLIAITPEEPITATDARASGNDACIVAHASTRQVLSPQVHNAIEFPVPDRLSASDMSRLGDSTTGPVEARDKIAFDSNTAVEAAKATATLANREALDAIQSTLNALLQSCQVKFPNATTEKADPDTGPMPSKNPNLVLEEPDRIKQVPSHAVPKTMNHEPPNLEDNLRPSDQKSYFNPQTISRWFDKGGQPDQPSPIRMSERPSIARNPYRRSRTAEAIYLQNPYAQTPPIGLTDLLRGHDAFRERQREGETRAVKKFQGHFLGMEDSDYGNHDELGIHGRFQDTEDVGVSHAYDPPDENIPVQKLAENWFDDVEQEELAASLQTYPETVNTDHQTVSYHSNTVPRGLYANFNQPLRSQKSDVLQHLTFHTVDHPQSSRLNASLADSPFKARTPPPTRAQEKGTLQTRSTSRARDGGDIEPVGFWKPNRLY